MTLTAEQETAGELQHFAKFKFHDKKKRVVYGVAYPANEIDFHDEYTDEEELRKACHNFMADYGVIGIEHSKVAPASLVESYIATSDIKLGDQSVKAGSWVIGTRLDSDDLVKAVERGDYLGYSVGGKTGRVKETKNGKGILNKLVNMQVKEISFVKEPAARGFALFKSRKGEPVKTETTETVQIEKPRAVVSDEPLMKSGISASATMNLTISIGGYGPEMDEETKKKCLGVIAFLQGLVQAQEPLKKNAEAQAQERTNEIDILRKNAVEMVGELTRKIGIAGKASDEEIDALNGLLEVLGEK